MKLQYRSYLCNSTQMTHFVTLKAGSDHQPVGCKGVCELLRSSSGILTISNDSYSSWTSVQILDITLDDKKGLPWLNKVTIYITYLLLRWVNPLIKKGWKKELKMGDIYKWTYDSDATQLAYKLEGYVFERGTYFSYTYLIWLLKSFKWVHQGALESFH